MSRAGIEQLLYMMDQAFEGVTGESLMGNLMSVPYDLWTHTPPGGKRTVRDIVRHVGEARYVYDNHAFGDQSMRWGSETWPKVADGASPEELIGWLRQGHKSLRDHVAGLADDSELLAPRLGWSLSLTMETRRVVGIMVMHDAYHAGEINHIRALALGND